MSSNRRVMLTKELIMANKHSPNNAQPILLDVEGVSERTVTKRARRRSRSRRARRGEASPNDASHSSLPQRAAQPSSYDEISSDPITLYLKEVCQISLLSRKREVALAKQIEAGKLAAEKLCQDGLTAIDIVNCEEIIAQGNEARDELIEANYRLVISITKRYMSQGVSFLDLVQEGNIGLIKAVDKFDYHRGYKFSTYATWWIRQAVTRALADQGRTIRIPVHMCERINKLTKTTHKLTQELGRDPTMEEVAVAMGTSVKGVTQLQKIAQHPLAPNPERKRPGSYIVWLC